MARQKTRSRITRRQFVRLAAAAGLGTVLASCGEEQAEVSPAAAQAPTRGASTPTADSALATATRTGPEPTRMQADQPASEAQAEPSPMALSQDAYLSVARGSDPRAITLAALAAIGGIGRFVKAGDDVIVKPNICHDYHSYEYATTTNPEVVAALVELCRGAGAKRVRVMDSPFGGGPQSAYAKSGIADAVAAAGGEMEAMVPAKFQATDIPEGRDITNWPVYREVLTADVLIDVPIAKHHSLARLTLAGKNLMGVISTRSGIHANLGQRIADLVTLIRPTLTVVDAVRTLMAHGPTGGNLDDVRLTNTVIASHDIVAADAYAATLFDLTGYVIAYVKAAAEMGLGTLDLDSITIEEIAL